MKHIRLYLIALSIACSMFMVCPFAYADSFTPNSITSLQDALDLNGNISDTNYNIILDTFNTYCPYIQFYFNPNDHSIAGQGTNIPGQYVLGLATDSTRYGIGLYYLASSDLSSLSYVYKIYVSSNGNVNLSKIVPGQQGNWYSGSTSFTPSLNQYYDNIDSVLINETTGYIYLSSYFLYASHDYDTFIANNRGNIYPLTYSVNDLIYLENLPSYSDDDRLKFAIVDNVFSGKNLMTDIRQFVNDFPIQDTSHSSVLLYPESINLTYNVDNVEKSITLNSSNSSIKSKYIFETDLSNFDFDDSAENVIITKCDFTISGNTQGGQTETENYNISCNYYIKRFVQPIEQGSNPYESSLNGDQTSQEIKDSLQYLVTFREGYGLDFDEYSDLSFPDYYTYADVYLYNNTAAYNYLMDNILSVNAVAYVIQSLANSEEDVIKQIGMFLDDSNYGEYYDVIVFDWIQETSSTYTHTYFYFETVSGRVKATTQFLQVMQDDLNKVKINTAAAFTAIDNFESESIQFFNAKLGLDADLLGWVKTIDNSINNLVFPVYDDSNIVSLLGQIKDLLSSPSNEIDTPQECIQLYEAHPNYFNELWGTPTPALRSVSVTPSANNPYISSDYVRADLVPAWWEGKTLTMIYILKNDGETSRFYNDILNGLFDSYENLIESDNSFNTYIDSLFKTGYDYTSSFYGHLFDLDYTPEAWDGGFSNNE